MFYHSGPQPEETFMYCMCLYVIHYLTYLFEAFFMCSLHLRETVRVSHLQFTCS